MTQQTRQLKTSLKEYNLKTKELETSLDELKKRIYSNKASLMVIDGAQGEGKTTLAVQCAEYYQQKELNLKEQIGLGGEDFKKKLEIAINNKYPVLIYDEAGDFDRRGALTKFNREINRVFDTFRTFQILIILVLPSFIVLDNSIFQKGVPRLLLHCQNRNKTIGRIRGYGHYRMSWLRYNMQKAVVPGMSYNYTRPNFNAYFMNLSQKRSDELHNISTQAKYEANFEGLITMQDIGETIGRSKSWVYKKLKEIGLKPRTRKGNVDFYGKDAEKILLDEIKTK